MFLKALSIKGFKSFADPTTLDFEPGVTVVVGPNGSGKSNVVDAIAWVLGAQGPSVVRSQKMDDVIFAGTHKRAPLGRAEVTLVIDNSARRLAIDLNEVSISRTLFRSGESEYAINGVACRLLDVQELLSDTGVGRQQHVVVGQGQLDTVLQARPEDRRAIIEEAAGVLKYRRRRERAERRLDASEASLARVQDLLREVNRQVKPLERQATSARRHAELERELGAMRLFLQGRELAELSGRLAALDDQAVHLERTLSERTAELEAADERLGTIEAELGAERADELAPVVARLEQLAERTRGYLALVQERRRAGAQLALAFEGSADLDAELGRIADEITSVVQHSSAVVAELAALAGEERRLAGLEVEAATRRELSVRANERAALLVRQADALEGRVSSAGAATERLAADLERAGAALTDAEQAEAAAAQQVAEADSARRGAEEQRHSSRTRVEVLELALDEARAKAGVARLADVSGVVGTLLDVVEVEDDLVLAFEAAVEPVLDAVLVEAGPSAIAALGRLREARAGGKILPISRNKGAVPSRSVPTGAASLRDAVRSDDPAVAVLLDRLIGDVEVVRGDPETVIARVLERPEGTFVTPDGDRFSPLGWRIGAGRAGATRAALDAARQVAEQAVTSAEEAERSAEAARQNLDESRAETNTARRMVDRLSAEQAANDAALEKDSTELASILGELEVARLEVVADADVVGSDDGVSSIASLQDALGVRRFELERSVAANDARKTMLEERRSSLESMLAERHALGAVEAGSFADDSALEGLAERLSSIEHRLDAAVAKASVERDRRIAASRARLDRLGASRRTRDELDRAVGANRERHQRVEIERAEARIRHQSAIEQLQRDFDVTVDEALAAPAPELPPGVEARTRANELERELAALGPVNPLAAEELAALEERRFFLDGQLEDVRSARRELNRVIAAIDAEIVEVFTAAYADVERNFSELIAMLFPGGSGRLELLEPEDLLSTGVEIEVNPAGRRVRRLSLLSGGERSLVALGFLFAVFRSRPSPFYVLDEVEAALDDVNLGRFLGLVDEFRAEAQLLIVSHQKRTMEIADALYGISLQPGGASKVVSEKVETRRSMAFPTAEAS